MPILKPQSEKAKVRTFSSNDRDEEVGFILTRRGFAWKLTNVVLPEHELEQRALTGWSGL